MTLNSGDGDKPTTSGSEKKVAFSDIDGEEEMAKIPEEDEEDLQVEEMWFFIINMCAIILLW